MIQSEIQALRQRAVAAELKLEAVKRELEVVKVERGDALKKADAAEARLRQLQEQLLAAKVSRHVNSSRCRTHLSTNQHDGHVAPC